MSTRSLNSVSVVREAYGGWTVYVRWYASWAFTGEGWIFKLLPPGVDQLSQAIRSNTRYQTSADALAAGKVEVDRKIAGMTLDGPV